jgi:hypothetical protein
MLYNSVHEESESVCASGVEIRKKAPWRTEIDLFLLAII